MDIVAYLGISLRRHLGISGGGAMDIVALFSFKNFSKIRPCLVPKRFWISVP